MKVRFLLHDVYGPGGGVVTVTLALAEELAKRHDVELVSVFGSNRPSVHALPSNVRVTSLVRPARDAQGGLAGRARAWASSRPSRVIPTAERRHDQYSRYSDQVLRRYLRSLDGGVLVTMQPGLNVAAARLGTNRYVRIAQDHLPIKARPRQLLEAYQQHADGLDMFLVLTKADARRARRLLGDRVPVRSMGNGTPDYAGPHSTQENKTVAAAGRLARIKGFDLLIAAWVQVAAAHPDWQLEIWGEGGLRGELEQQIEELGLRDQVRLMGYSNQLEVELSRASLFVLSSRAEGWGMVLVEAMACAVPVISVDCPTGPREIVTSGVNGVLVPTEDPAALGAAINDMIERGPEARRDMGRAGLARARELSQSSVAERWESLFTELDAQRRSTGRRRTLAR